MGGDSVSALVMDPLSERRMIWQVAPSGISNHALCLLQPHLPTLSTLPELLFARPAPLFRDLIMCVAILYSAVEIPFTCSFLWAPPFAMRVIDILVDSLLLCDVLVCFFTGYVDQDDKKTMNHWKVVKHYFLGWFIFDIVSALPYDTIAKSFLPPEDRIASFQNQAFRILNVLKLIRLVRLQKLVRYLFRWNDDLGLASSHSLFTQTACILFFLFLFIHTVGCIEFLVPMMSGFPADCWPRLLADLNISQVSTILNSLALSLLLTPAHTSSPRPIPPQPLAPTSRSPYPTPPSRA